MGLTRAVRPAELVAAAIDHVALEGREGLAVSELMDAVEPSQDARMRRQMWILLRRQQERGVLQFFYEATPSPATATASAGKKRKRPTGSCASNGATTASRPAGVVSNGARTEETSENDTPQSENAAMETSGGHTDTAASREDTTTAKTGKTTPKPAVKDPKREPIDDAEAIAYEEACPVGNLAQLRHPKRVFVVACEELRLRALNVSRKAILAEFGDDHLKILEAIGRTRTQGITIPALCGVFGKASTVKKIHNSLDTLISYNLVVKRMMIVARPAMRRLNIVHLPRFAAQFVPEMFEASAEFESDEACKRILASAAEAYLKEMPTKSAVMYDLGRDLGFQRRHLEVLKNHIVQECKRDDSFHLELFQAVLQPPKKSSSVEPKILNCVRYRPPSTDIKDAAASGMSLEVGLLHQIYGVIEENGENGTTIIDLRDHMVLPGNKLPYKLVSILAGTYGLRAEAIILGKNKAFRLYPMLAKGAHVRDTKKQQQAAGVGLEDEDDVEDITVIPSSSSRPEAAVLAVPASSEPREGELFSIRANLALKVALGGTEVEGTRQRRRDHIMTRLATEKIISLSSLRASMFVMEKRLAVSEAVENADGTPGHAAHVGMVDTRSVSRIAAELEEDGLLRLLQLPLPPRNVSTKFRALRCVVLPGHEHDEAVLHEFLKNYGRDERLRRIRQNADRHEVVQLRAIDSEDEDVPGFTLYRRPRKRQRAAAPLGGTAVEEMMEVDGGGGEQLSSPAEVSYRVRRFVSQDRSSVHSHQYRRLGFAYGVMYRCKQLHQFLWQFLHAHPEIHLRDEDMEGAATSAPRGVVFSRETVLHRLPVYLYILAFSGGSVLSPHEFSLVEHAVQTRASFDTLPPAVCAKVWAHESTRTAKVLGTLSDLRLVVPHKIGMRNLIKILRAGYTDDRDSILAQALKDNALGGLFRLRTHVRIVLDCRASSSPTQDPTTAAPLRLEDRGFNAHATLKLVGTTERAFSFGTLLPLRHSLHSVEDVDRFWEAFEGLCLERMIMEVPSPKPNEPLVCEVPLPVKSRARRMFRILAWIPKSQKAPASKDKTDKPEPKLIKRTGIVSRTVRARKRRGPRAVKKKVKAKEDVVATQRRRRVATEADGEEEEEEEEEDVFAWSEADERQLLDSYLDNCRSRWQIPVPLGLQRDDESVAFRVPRLSRSGFGLVAIARKLGKRKIDVKKRLKEKLTEPQGKLLLEAAKRAMVAQRNPRGEFDEERAIVASPRLTALFRRAVMMIVSPQRAYHPLVAEELISFWRADEIRLVWRYLWLKNWIVRATDTERVRGYAMSQKLHDFVKTTTLTHALSLFTQAAQHEAMVASTLEEEDASSSTSCFEAEFPANATPGQCALELGWQVLGVGCLTPVYSAIVEEGGGGGDEEEENRPMSSKAVRKRTLRFLNYKNQKESTGFTAHLSKRIPFKNPAILTESWQVETTLTAVTLDAFQSLEAFSSVGETAEEEEEEEEARPPKRARVHSKSVRDAVEQLVRGAGEGGLALDELTTAVASERGERTARADVAAWADTLVADGVLVCVNAYASVRYIARAYGDQWLLRPYSLQHAEDSAPPRVVFEGEKDVVSFPWLKMDGATNHRFLFAVQRKLLSWVLLHPGISEELLHRRMDMLLSLQDTREAMALLVEDGLVYARASAAANRGGPSLFGQRKKRRRDQPGPCITVATVAGHELLHVDRAVYQVHFFPHLQCIQRFGSIVQDYQNEVADAGAK